MNLKNWLPNFVEIFLEILKINKNDRFTDGKVCILAKNTHLFDRF